ncbi:MAG: hypothetical protein LBI36_00830, partial [Oscillospiraceae bacterium]|nr:hypothetical protein [Oscillospiraceae bacterium]
MIFNQVKAGIKKEFLFIWRGFRLGGIALAFFASLCLIFTNGLPDDAVMYPIIATTCAGVGVFTALILLYGAAGREQTKRAIII